MNFTDYMENRIRKTICPNFEGCSASLTKDTVVMETYIIEQVEENAAEMRCRCKCNACGKRFTLAFELDDPPIIYYNYEGETYRTDD